MGEKVKFMLENWNNTLNQENIMDYQQFDKVKLFSFPIKDAQNTHT